MNAKMKRLTYRNYKNKDLASDYWKVKSADMDLLDTPEINRRHFGEVRDIIRKTNINIPKFYCTHGGSLTKLVIHGVSPLTITMLKEILEDKLGKPQTKEEKMKRKLEGYNLGKNGSYLINVKIPKKF